MGVAKYQYPLRHVSIRWC